MKGIYKRVALLLVLLLLSSTLSAAMFAYETVTGSLNSLQLDSNSSTSNPIADEDDIENYEDDEYYSTDGYLGRYIFQGSPTIITINNIGQIAEGTGSPPRFYYTRVRRNANL